MCKMKHCNEFSEQLIEATKDGISVLDSDGVHIYVNKALCQMTGFSEEELIGTGIPHPYWPEEERLRIQTCLQKALNNIFEDCELVFQRKDGKRFPVIVSPSCVVDKENNPVCFFATFKDITDRKRIEENLRERTRELEAMQASQLKQAHEAGMAEMAAEVLHNIGNAITPAHISTLTLSKTLQESPLKKELPFFLHEIRDMLVHNPSVSQETKQRMELLAEKLPQIICGEMDHYIEVLQKISAKHRHIQNIITLQNSYARLPGNFESVDLNHLLDDALQMLEETLHSHAVRVVKRYEQLPKIRVEKSKLIQILINLIKNAQEAMQENPIKDRLLTITTMMEPGTADFLSCRIKDNGCGFSAAQKSKLFSFGYTTKAYGFGFGLHSCANYLIGCDGSIDAHSKGPGLGAEFIIRLPARQAEADRPSFPKTTKEESVTNPGILKENAGIAR